MRESRHRMLGSLLDMKAPEVRELILSRKFGAARTAIIPLMAAFQKVGPKETVNSPRSLAAQRMLRFVNKVQSYVEVHAADNKRISNKSLNSMAMAFDMVVDQARQVLSETETVPDHVEDARDRRTTSAYEPENIDEVRIKLANFDASRDEVRRDVSKYGYTLKKVPILFNSEPFLDMVKVKRYFNADSFEGWPVLKQQIVLGMTSHYIKKKGVKFLTQKQRTLQLRDPKNPSLGWAGPLFLEMIEALNEKYPGKKYIAVAGVHVWDHASWMWVMPAKEYNLLRSCSAAPSTLRVKAWSLAFSNDSVEG